MKNNKILLAIAGLLVLVGLSDKFNIDINKPINVDVMELSEPSNPNLLKEAKDIVSIVKANMPKEEAKKLRNLYLDIKQLISLVGEDEVITNTEEIRQANSLAGLMLKMDIKGKYPNLAKECKEVITTAIGDDKIVLSPELRSKGLDGFDALAWAFNEGSK
jgi:hypothetical protein